jgi:hypothetical protein
MSKINAAKSGLPVKKNRNGTYSIHIPSPVAKLPAPPLRVDRKHNPGKLLSKVSNKRAIK